MTLSVTLSASLIGDISLCVKAGTGVKHVGSGLSASAGGKIDPTCISRYGQAPCQAV
jgi:hypothetical protein